MKSILKLWIVTSLITGLALLVTGCWDRRDITEMGIATAIGFDMAEKGQYEFTAQIVRPAVLKAQGQGSTEKAYWSTSAVGETVFSAIRNLLTTQDRKTYFNHVQVVIIGEDLAREKGIAGILDIFERDQETRTTAFVLISRGISARKILEIDSQLESIPSTHINAVIKNNDAVAKLKAETIFEIIRCMECPGFEPPIGVIQPKEFIKQPDRIDNIKDLEVKGSAVFKKDKLLGYIDCFATRGLMFALGEVNSAIINIDQPENKGKKVAIEILGSSGKIDAELKEGKLTLKVEVEVEGRIGVQEGGGLCTPQVLGKAGELTAEVIKADIVRALKLAQEYKSDFFGFSKVVHRKYNDFWKEKVENWSEEFSKAKINVEVKGKMLNSGLIRKPLQP